MPSANVHLAPVINSSLPYIQATSSRILECFFFQAQTALLPNDGVFPTASTFTECFEENFLPNGVSLPNSAHKSVSFLYKFLVLTHVLDAAEDEIANVEGAFLDVAIMVALDTIKVPY
jgi:hypothetical protein